MSSVVNIYVGLLIMIGSEAATLAQIEPFWSWNTPIAWTGFILFADAIVYRARGNSWMRSAPREFAALAFVSIPLWAVFEGYNLIIDNWNYVGLPENAALRSFGYAWSFATIWPAIFEGAELIAVLRAGKAGGEITLPAPPAPPALFIVAGALMLACPFLASPAIARYLAAPIWLGFVFLLDPINARLGGASLLDDWRHGQSDRLINLILSGFLCGGLWEFWNYWSRAKWRYTVPIMEHIKIFEMPVPGYLGFPAFALECFTMYVFVRVVWLRFQPDPAAPNTGRRIAL
ncbi:MAG: hypothetical protein HY048_10265 [Acidobacteria bacterium]|nr:hypothetical protein [Acidobacteriota bacterium]